MSYRNYIQYENWASVRLEDSEQVPTTRRGKLAEYRTRQLAFHPFHACMPLILSVLSIGWLANTQQPAK